MAISFNAIPISIRVPGVYVEIDNTKAFRGLYGLPTRILVVGQRLSSSAIPTLTPERFTRADQALARCGNSMLGHMLSALLTASDWTETWAIALDDNPAGAKAAGLLAFAGTATAAGTLNLYFGGVRVQIGVAAGATATQVASDVADAITAADGLLVSAVVDGEDDTQVDLTFAHKGVTGNNYDVRHSYYAGDGLPAGVTLAITALAGGSGNPDIQDALDRIGDDWYTDLVCPYTDTANLAAAEAKAAGEFGPLVMHDLHVWAAAAGSFSTLTSLGDSRNSPHLTIIGAQASPTPPWLWASVLAAISAYYLSIDPARPLQTLALPGVLPPLVADRFNLTERNQLLFDGIATWRATADGQVVIERAVTTYETNAFGAVDPSYLDVETLRTLAFLRFDLRNYIAVTFSRYKLADDGTAFGRGQAVVTPRVIRSAIVARFGLWQAQGLAENVDQFKSDLIVERDANDPNRVNCLVPPDIVNQLRVVAAQLQFRL
ncbi:MAG: phage tail protein [Candidatus Hydrogenedens sp.]|nr:phage tail protein [Candidatus Hydrogenedens sp.]